MRRFRMLAWALGPTIVAVASSGAGAQDTVLTRLPRDVFDASPPSVHVRGTPGNMAVQPQPCRSLPLAQTRRRIVDLAVQEWGFFGFRVVDQTAFRPVTERAGNPGTDPGAGERRGGRRRPRLAPDEAARVATSIAGYWAVTPEGSWIVGRQNDEWSGRDGIAARWNAPWSAAFISWVMCEGGLGTPARFQRAVAHHTYIDQAIRARDGIAAEAAYIAYDIGETAVLPGDLLCSSRRPAYRSIAERRRQLGVGARSHCDVVVSVDEPRRRILAIGGNVRGTVSLKSIGASREGGRPLRPYGAGDETRPFFAHLKLRAPGIDENALGASPTMAAFGCEVAKKTPLLFAAAETSAPGAAAERC